MTRDLLAALAWQVELGADEAIADAPQDRFAESRQRPAAPAPEPGPALAPVAKPAIPPGAPAPTRPLAESAGTLDALAALMRDWEGTPLRASARNFVFADGQPGAPLMIVGEAPGQEEDRQGKPFVGPAGQLLDRMLAAIGYARDAADPARAVYITNMLPWRPPGNRTPSEAEAAAFLPFVEQHIRLAAPRIVLAMGNTPVKALLGTTTGIRRMRGTWVHHQATGTALLASFHPAYLLRQPEEKRHAWADLLALSHALDTGPPVAPS